MAHCRRADVYTLSSRTNTGRQRVDAPWPEGVGPAGEGRGAVGSPGGINEGCRGGFPSS
jgi:hypothetical protein